MGRRAREAAAAAAAAALAAEDSPTMALHINITFGPNTFDVDGDVPDLTSIVELFRIWINQQSDPTNDAPAIEAQIAQLEQNTTDLDTAVKATTPAS